MDISFGVDSGLLVVAVLGIGAVLLALFFLGAGAARFSGVDNGHRRYVRPSPYGGLRWVVGGMIGVFLLMTFGWYFSFQEVREEEIRHRNIEQMKQIEAQIEQEQARRRALESVEEGSESKGADQEAESEVSSVPGWARSQELIVQTGSVNVSLLVAKSELCATQQEALDEARVRALATLQDRFDGNWSYLSDWPIPLALFNQYSVKRTHFESELHEFAGVREPMYRAYIQFKDSQHVREQIDRQRREHLSGERAKSYAAGLGVLAVGLGLLSAFLRTLLVVSDKRRKMVSALAAAVVASGGVALLLIA